MRLDRRQRLSRAARRSCRPDFGNQCRGHPPAVALQDRFEVVAHWEHLDLQVRTLSAFASGGQSPNGLRAVNPRDRLPPSRALPFLLTQISPHGSEPTSGPVSVRTVASSFVRMRVGSRGMFCKQVGYAREPRLRAAWLLRVHRARDDGAHAPDASVTVLSSFTFKVVFA